jgi:hypothetical protein
MFFVTLLLEQVRAWIRGQSGTTSLRCLIYFDEIFGYFPPYPANPPSKSPLLQLLKQARAYGVGLVLTTQNPVDLDYKGLTNAGTWFIGKLQTDRDKMRVLEGLETIDVAAGDTLDRAYYDMLISSLAQRVFILHNVHEPKPVVFMTRWAMSYLRGPLTKSQVRTLMAPHKGPEVPPEPVPPDVAEPSSRTEVGIGYSPVAPRFGPDVRQYFLLADRPLERAVREEEERLGVVAQLKSGKKVYRLAIVGGATVYFEDARRGVAHREEYRYLVPVPEDLAWIDWHQGRASFRKDDLLNEPSSDVLFGDVPASLAGAKGLKAMRKNLVDHLYREARLSLYHNKRLRLYSEVGESEGRFVQRCQEQAAVWQEGEKEKADAKYRSRMDRLEDRLRREERELSEDRIEYDGRKREETLGLGESVLGLFTGRRSSRALSQASRRRRMTAKARADVEESEEVISELEEEIDKVRRDWDDALRELGERADQMSREVQEVQIKPKKANIDLPIFGVAWLPFWHISYDDGSGLAKAAVLQAYRGRQEEPGSE